MRQDVGAFPRIKLYSHTRALWLTRAHVPPTDYPVGMNRQQEFVLRTLDERDIRFVRLWFTDVQ